MDGGSLLGVLAIFALVGTNGFFVAAEFALVKVRKTRIDQLVVEGKRGAQVVQRELAHLDTYIAATQLGITLASLALGWLGEPALAHLIEPLLFAIVGAEAHTMAEGIGVAISFGVITIFHIVLGELVPKSIALQRSESVSLFVARPLFIFDRVFRPIIFLMNSLGNQIVRALGMQVSNEHISVHSVEELEMLVSQSRQAGVLDRAEENLLRRVFDFGDKTASEVMMPRTEVVGVAQGMALEALADFVIQQRYTRFPVYAGTIDNIIGIVHIKDLLAQLRKNPSGAAFDIQQILRPVLEVPESFLIEELLPLMQSRKAHMVVVLDEYGGTAGIVTLEDIIEEIVGEVQDEFDTGTRQRRPVIEILPDGTTSVDGLLTLRDFAERFGVDFEDSDYETIGGYVFGALGRAPIIGDEVAVGQYGLRVEELDNLRIARLRLIAAPSAPGPDAASALPQTSDGRQPGRNGTRADRPA